MPLLRKQPFVRNKPPIGLKPENEVFFCEATKEVFTNYDEFFQRVILCNSLVWSCSVTGKANMTFEEALECEQKAKKRIGNLPKPLKRGILWLARHTKRGRLVEVSEDVHDFARQRYFKGEIIEAVINDQWYDAKITKVIAPTQAEIDADKAEADDEIIELDTDGSPKKEADKAKPLQTAVPDHLFKYEVEEVEPDDEDMVMLHIIPAADCRREKGVYTKDKLNLYLKNVVELEGVHFKVKEKLSKMYNLEQIRFEDIFAGPPPTFAVTQNKKAVMNKNKKGQFTLDGWIKDEKATLNKTKAVQQPPKMQQVKPQQPSKPQPQPKPVKIKQTPEEIEAEMKRMRERQEARKEEMRIKLEKEKQRRQEERIKEKERKKEEQKIAKELMQEWSKRRDDLEIEDLKELPKPTPVRCHIPNKMFGEFISILEFLNSFQDILAVKDTYPGGLTFAELETALTEKEVPDGAFFDILSFMLITVFDLQMEEIEEAKADTDASVLDEADKNIVGRDEDTAAAIIEATKTSHYTKNNLGLKLRDCHVDVWSLTEILRLHLESSGGYRGHSLQVWRWMQRGGYRLQDDPGFQFCRDEPQILTSLRETIVTELEVGDKLKLLSVLMAQMLTYAGVRDEIDTRLDNMIEANKELRDAVMAENKRIREQVAEDKREKKEEQMKRREEVLKEMQKNNPPPTATADGKEAPKPAPVPIIMSERQREAQKAEEEKREKEKQRKEEIKRSEFLYVEQELQNKILDAQNQVYVHCLGRDRAFRRFYLFDSLPGIFVEHEDDEIGGCLEAPTPWSAEPWRPITEEEALEKAKEILAKTDEDGEVDLKLSEVKRSVKPAGPVLKQQTLTADGKIKSPEAKPATTATAKMETDLDKPSAEDGAKEEEEAQEIELGQQQEEEKPVSPPWGLCTSPQDTCTVHSTIMPKTHWAFYSTVEELDQLIESLNPRGIREGELREKLIADRENIERVLKKAGSAKSTAGLLTKTEEDLEAEAERALDAVKKKREKNAKWGGALALPVGTPIKDVVELSLCDQIIELEEKIFIGSLGALKVDDRIEWQNALQTREYKMGCDELVWAGDKRLTAEQLKAPSAAGSPDSKRSSGGSTTAFKGSVVKQLAAAILQVGQMINDVDKYLKAPLGEDEKEKKKRQREEERQRKERETEEEEGVICEDRPDAPLTPFQRWEQSLMACTSINQLFLHLTTLDSSVVWSKSIMNTKCKICRRKTDPEKMLLCDGCDRGHHIYCLKPKLKSIPKDDWYCAECKPKERVRSPKKTVRRVFSSTEESEDDDEEAQPEPDKDDDSADDDDVAVVPAPKKKKQPKAKRKLVQEPEPEPEVSKKKKKKGGIAGLLAKRKAVEEDEEEEQDELQEEEEEEEIVERSSRRPKRKAKSRAVSEDEEEEEEEEEETRPTRRGGRRANNKSRANSEDEEEEATARSRRRGGKKGNKDDNKENARSKRRRGGIDDSIELEFNVSGLTDLIKSLMSHKDGWPFDRPITKADAPDYHKIIKNPMDLGTIRSRLNGMKYNCNQEVLDDIRLVFTNCIQYNMEDAEEYQCALRLRKVFDRTVAKMGLTEEEEEVAVGQPKSKRSRRTF